MEQPFGTDHVDYLQRAGRSPGPPPPGVPWTTALPALTRLSRVRGVGRFDRPFERVAQWETHQPTEDVLAGLHGDAVPVAFVIRGESSRVGLYVGTWSAEGGPSGTVVADELHGTLASLLDGVFPAVDLEPTAPEEEPLVSLPLRGLAFGVPSAGSVAGDGSAPVDRLVRVLRGVSWGVLVLAYPLADAFASALRRTVINELRAVETAAGDRRQPSPLARHYSELLASLLERLTVGHAVGTWRTAVYLFGPGAGYTRLASAWRGIFSGDQSRPEPLRVVDVEEWAADQRELAARWAMPDTSAPPGPGRYTHPFEHQTLLTSAQLARYVHLPALEVPGFAIETVPAFDTAPRAAGTARAITLGDVVHLKRRTTTSYELRLDDLVRHVFVAGLTGSGKTNTIVHLLEEADAAGIPFLVIEPTKAEYRALLSHPEVGPRLRVFTLGDERVSPFRLNPFDVPAGTTVAQHLDLLRSVFAAGFGMWTPLPQVLERALHEVYVDRGWDLVTDENPRLDDGGDRSAAFPTLGGLVAKVSEVVPALGYEQRVTDDIRAALVTRVEALRAGAKGRMLDVRGSLPMHELVAHPTVLELEPLADDDDKAFLMALLVVRLAEHRRGEGPSPGLRHLLVIEEAHRVLAAAPRRTSEEQADPRGKAVETFSQLLSEIRAYGQGVVVADQVPGRLAADVIKNTAIKIAHQMVAADDRLTLANAMAMDDQQARSLTALPPGEAAVFGVGDDAPVLVAIPKATTLRRPDDAEVAKRMRVWRSESPFRVAFEPAPYCAETCAAEPEACARACALVGDPAVASAFARIVLSTVEDPDALDRLWPDFVAVIRSRRSANIGEAALLRSLAGHLSASLASRRGVQAGWTYTQTDAFAARLRASLLEKLDGAQTAEARAAFCALARLLLQRSYEPYARCAVVCDQTDPPLCVYRHWLAELVATGHHRERWQAADRQDLEQRDGRAVGVWNAAQDAAYEAIEFPGEGWSRELHDSVAAAARRASLCFAQQMVTGQERRAPHTTTRVLDRILNQAGVRPATKG
jgi:hypothetical protein